MILAYDLQKTPAEKNYRGCGNALAAIHGGKVIALRYVEEPLCPDNAPAWVAAIFKNAEGNDASGLPDAWSSKGLARLAHAASACADCPKRRNGTRYRPKEILAMARAALLTLRAHAQKEIEQCARGELSELGEVVSGKCSCWQFVMVNP